MQQQFIDLLREMPKHSRFALIHDSDADGISSAMLLVKTLEALEFDVIGLYSHSNKSHMIDAVSCYNIAHSKPDVIITVDVDFLHLPNHDLLMKLCEEVCDTQVRYVTIDHHSFNEEYSQHDIIYIHPSQLETDVAPAQYCTAKLVYDTCLSLGTVEKYGYFAALGILGDGSNAVWHTFMQEVAATFSFAGTAAENHQWFSTPLKYPLELLFCATSVSNDAYRRVSSYFYLAKDFDELIELTTDNPYNHVLPELDTLVEEGKHTEPIFEFDVDGESVPVIVFTHHSPYHISSVLSSKLSYTQPDAIWLVLHPHFHIMRIHARNVSGQIHLGKLMREVSSQFSEGTGGGHIPAAAGKVLLEDVDAFINKVRTHISEYILP